MLIARRISMFAGYVCGVWQVSILGTCPFSELERATVAFAYTYTENTYLIFIFTKTHVLYIHIYVFRFVNVPSKDAGLMRVFAMAGQYGNSTLNTDLPINHLTWQADAVQDFYSILSMFGMSHGELERIQPCWPKMKM